MENELGLLWMGFEQDTLADWMQTAGLQRIHIEAHAPDAKSDLPASFVAAASKPDSTEDR